MITEDDSRNTLELPDRYVIYPTLYAQPRQYDPAERRLPDDFSYRSDNNTEWLDDAAMAALLEQIDH
jgi:UDP-N-acetylglucosamine 4,6-dehydratase